MDIYKTTFSVVAVVLALVCFAGVAVMLALSFAHAEMASPIESRIEAEYDGQYLTVKIPFSKPVTGFLKGKLTCTLIDMDDKKIAEAERSFVLRKRKSTVTMEMPVDLKPADFAATRIKYSFVHQHGDASGIVATQAVMDWLEVRVLGQNELLSGSAASIRIIALNHRSMDPVSGAKVTITLSVGDKTTLLYQGKTNASGTSDPVVRIPELSEEDAKLIISVDSDIGKNTVEKSVKLIKVTQTYLVTDKPLYQPNQTIHMRTITLTKPSMLPLQAHDVVLEVLDSKGNKVFKKKNKTNEFGVCSAEFRLADEINMGRYKVSAIVGDDKTEKTVTVEKYVLPKFNVRLKTDKEYYMPGEVLEGTVSSVYFFGKPVTGGKVKVTLSKFDVGFTDVGEAIGKTDKEGNYEFELQLPKYFVGQPLEQGNAFVKLDIEVKDLAEHIEKKSETRTVARSPIRITLIPESGEIVPRVKNRIFAMTTYPDGTPAISHVTLNDMEAETDDMGVATFEILPTKDSALMVDVIAKDKKGNTATQKRRFNYNMNIPHLLLRTDQAIYKAGKEMKATILCTKKTGVAYVDIIKDGQTMLTKSLKVKDGEAATSIVLTQDLSGTVKIHAYMIGQTSDIARDTRTVYVNPANDLSINIRIDKKTYRPGEDGTIHFAVTNKKGKPVVSAIGIAIVDEAVFALTEMQPGMEKVYFTLEKEIMTPRYEIHGFTPEQIVLPFDRDVRKQKAATILFASFQETPKYTINANTYQEIESVVLQKTYSRMMKDMEKLRRAIRQFNNEKKRYPTKDEGLEPLVRAGFLKSGDLLDPWGTPYEIITRGNDLRWFDVRSFGPDKKKGTADDVQPSYGWRHVRGGRGGRVMFEADEMMMPGPMMNEGAGVMKKAMAPDVTATSRVTSPVKTEEPRIRRYFPETMLFKPDIITNKKGRAFIKLKWADSITEWRLTSTASSATGQLGSKTRGITVFQDFFVDIDLPVSLTEGDEVSIPVAVYNYLKQAQNVKLVMTKEDWFELLSDQTVTRTLQKDEVTVVYFRIRVTGIGRHSLTIKAYGSEMSDAISREIDVLPDGELFLTSVSDRLEGTVEKSIVIPARAIDGPSKIMVKVFPGIFSQIVDGLESMLRMPFGCFEQTSAITYPNVLILDYMRKTEQATPETEMTAEGFISIGYQRLMSYEVQGGGFEWFGNAPANKILTAFGLMQFKDMSRVYEIDGNVIRRTKDWLLNKQEKDGSWKPDASYLHAESWTRIQKNEMLPTAYISWALLEMGEKSDQVRKAINFIKENLDDVTDPYMLALCANALAAWDDKDASTVEVFNRLREKAIEEKGAVYWKSGIPTFTYSHGGAAGLETTALIAYALVKYGRMQDLTGKALTYLIRAKTPNGTWGGTQATIMALRALLASLGGNTENVDARIAIHINGKKAETLRLTKDNADVMRLVDLKEFTKEGTNDVMVELTGRGSCLYEIIAKYYLPWKETVKPPSELLSIDVDFDKTELVQNDMVTCNVKVRNNRPGTAHMVIVDLGIPPGFEVQAGDLAELVGTKIKKFNITGRQVIVYLEKVEGARPVEFSYTLRAKFPLKAKTVQSKVYEYYNPEIEAIAPPVEIVVK